MSWKGLLPATIRDARFEYDTKRKALRIPYMLPDGSVHRWKLRTDKREWWSEGRSLIPYGLETLCNGLRAAESCLCICEGESDTLALREQLAGMAGDGWDQWIYVIGAPGASLWASPAWDKYVLPWKTVVVLGDGDDAGEEFVSRTRELIVRAGGSCIGWTMPDGEDVRSVCHEVGPKGLLEEIRSHVSLSELFGSAFPPSRLGFRNETSETRNRETQGAPVGAPANLPPAWERLQ